MSYHLSHTARQSFKKCQRNYFYDYILRLELDADRTALRMGRQFAQCLEFLDPELAVRSLPFNPTDEQMLEAYTVRLLAQKYLERFPDHQTAQREVRFRDPVVGPGVLDAILPDNTGIECKLYTKNFWRDADRRTLNVDDQVTAYFVAMRNAGTPIDSLQYRITFKPTITWRRQREPETLNEYIERLADRIDADPWATFETHTLTRTSQQMDDFEAEAEEVALQERRARRRGVYPKNTAACTMYGGCQYLSLCVDEPGAMELYRQKPERPKLTPAQRATLSALEQAITQTATALDIARQTGRTAGPVTRTLRALEQKGLVEYVEETGVWRVRPTGS